MAFSFSENWSEEVRHHGCFKRREVPVDEDELVTVFVPSEIPSSMSPLSTVTKCGAVM